MHTRGTGPGRFTYHFAWGLDDIAAVFAEMWGRLGPWHHAGCCLRNDDLQGQLLRHPTHGFVPVASARGHYLAEPGGYREPAQDFTAHLGHFRDAISREEASTGTSPLPTVTAVSISVTS
ncbi:hypothetical protein AB0I82_06620 [Streptomyces sp. NPDC050315]|uniref:hypothetical protein n=1 Tax=Streptomyces sp. NPDC050315 TaxID=3155039 RepID=UPI0034314015